MSSKLKQLYSILITFAIYSVAINWKVALILIIGIGFHEQCHLWAAKKLGLNTGLFYMIPFFGGVAFIEGPYKEYKKQAFVVLMGPVGGGLLALVIAGIWRVTGLPLLAVTAYWMLLINLFNLLPLSFLDGGQLMDTVTYSINRTVGMVLHIISTFVAIFVIWHFNPLISVVIGFLGGSSVAKEYADWKHFYKGDKRKCSDRYLNPSTSLSKLDMALTMMGWIAAVIIMLVLMNYLSAFPESSISTLIPEIKPSH